MNNIVCPCVYLSSESGNRIYLGIGYDHGVARNRLVNDLDYFGKKYNYIDFRYGFVYMSDSGTPSLKSSIILDKETAYKIALKSKQIVKKNKQKILTSFDIQYNKEIVDSLIWEQFPYNKEIFELE